LGFLADVFIIRKMVQGAGRSIFFTWPCNQHPVAAFESLEYRMLKIIFLRALKPDKTNNHNLAL